MRCDCFRKEDSEMDKKMVYRPDLAEDATEFCPLCGAPVAPEEKSEPEASPAQPETAPRTVEELLALCASFEADPAAYHFYIGEDEKDAVGYGLFVDEFGDYVFYHNHRNQQRSIRYKGRDEAYAVGELYRRMKEARVFYRPVSRQEEGGERRHHHSHSGQSGRQRRKARRIRLAVAIGAAVVVCCVAAVVLRWRALQPKDGYYHCQGRYYYLQQHQWYAYDSVMDNWEKTDANPTIVANHQAYYRSIYYWEGSPVSDFRDSGYYDSGNVDVDVDVTGEPITDPNL